MVEWEPTISLKLIQNMRFVKTREFKKDIQISIDKPKYKETHMKSKTRHVDGSNGNTQFETFRL